jgi:hypothetical protein
MKRKHPKPPYYSSDPFSVPDAYPCTIESVVAHLLVSRRIGRADRS